MMLPLLADVAIPDRFCFEPSDLRASIFLLAISVDTVPLVLFGKDRLAVVDGLISEADLRFFLEEDVGNCGER